MLFDAASDETDGSSECEFCTEPKPGRMERLRSDG
jgi:hypothetical protein